MRALFLKGLSTYDATRLFTDVAAAAYERRGGEAVVVDLAEAVVELDALAEQISGQAFDFAFSIGLFGELRDSRGRTLAEVVGAPHVIQYVDYPLSHYARLSRTPAATAILVVDPTHADAVRAIYGPERFAHIAFSPHGAVGVPHATEARRFAEERPIDILLPASFYKPGDPLWRKLDAPTRKVFETAVEICLESDFTPALEALDQAIAQAGGHLREPLRTNLRVNAFAVHERVRAHRRFEMLKAAAKAGLRLHVAGEGYGRDLYRFKTVTHLGALSLPEVLDLMRKSKVVLSVNANFGRGSHERPLSAMLAGAVAATDASGFYDEAFEPGDLIQLRWSRLGEDLAELGSLVEQPGALAEIAARGLEKVAAAHRWDHRLDAIIAAAERARAA
jgi:hypothetical protein